MRNNVSKLALLDIIHFLDSNEDDEDDDIQLYSKIPYFLISNSNPIINNNNNNLKSGIL